MAGEIFTDTEDALDRWVDVRMTNTEEGEWDVDFVVADGQVEYVDLRVRPELLAGFLDCLIDDVGDERENEILSTVAERQDIDIRGQTGEK